MEVYVNMWRWSRHVLLAICDAEILGATLRDGEIVFKVREEFYKGFKTTVDEALDLIRQSTIVNMVGRNIVGKAVERGYVHPEAVLTISGVPHAQIVKM
ncbi:MAG: hypothetical protein AYL31_000010 [Candidatus Bathyarchaeota archaeon B26-1]|nr:MAG: hypothetical protein AYL31_000010 [Candidatus Bathyarchaeota archaeon B26-1]